MRTALTTSGLLSASAAIALQPGQLFSAELYSATAATLTIYDNASAASGLVLAQVVIPAGAAMGQLVFNHGIVANQGIYASLTGAGASFVVHYILGA